MCFKRNFCMIALAAYINLIGSFSSAAETTGRTPPLFLPYGYCLVGENHPADKQLLTVAAESPELKAGNYKLLAVFAPCKIIDAIRQGAAVGNTIVGMVTVPLANKKIRTTDESVSSLSRKAESEHSIKQISDFSSYQSFKYFEDSDIGLKVHRLGYGKSQDAPSYVLTALSIFDKVPVLFTIYHSYESSLEDQALTLASETYSLNHRYFQSLRKFGP